MIKMALNLSLVFVFIQCQTNSPEQQAINILHKEVMVIHDEVMPKMSDIYKLKKALKSSDGDVSKLIQELEAADDQMMDWMAQYKKPNSKQKDATTYLESQKLLVAKVKVDMLNAISNAEKHLKQ